jgi:hypothetical protein
VAARSNERWPDGTLDPDILREQAGCSSEAGSAGRPRTTSCRIWARPGGVHRWFALWPRRRQRACNRHAARSTKGGGLLGRGRSGSPACEAARRVARPPDR